MEIQHVYTLQVLLLREVYLRIPTKPLPLTFLAFVLLPLY